MSAAPTQEPPYLVFADATGRDAELVKTVPISRQPREAARVVMSLPLQGPKPGSPLLEVGDALRVGVELEVTVDGEAQADAYRRPYSFSPRVAVDLLLARERGAVEPDADTAIGLARRRPRTVGHTLHHYLAVIEARLSPVESQIARWDSSFVNVVVSAWHPDAAEGQVLLVGENEPGGAAPRGDKGRINVIRFRPSRPRARRLRTSKARISAIPLVKARRNLIYSLRLDELGAGEQLWFEAEVLARSALASPARVSTEIFLADGPSVTAGPGKEVASLCEFHGQVAKFNGTNCLPRASVRNRKLGVMRIRRQPPGPLYANLVATGSDPRHPGRSGESLKLGGGYLQAQRYRAAWTG